MERKICQNGKKTDQSSRESGFMPLFKRRQQRMSEIYNKQRRDRLSESCCW